MTASLAEMNWKPRSMRKKNNPKSSESGAISRNEKRNRLGNRRDRNLYTNAKAHKLDPSRYAELCAKADTLNGVRR